MKTLTDLLVSLQLQYIRSREAIVFLENADREKKAYLGPHNELRNALDHTMKMIQKKDDEDDYYEEYRGAMSHLLRAGYDAYELICIIHIDYIKNVLSKYSSEDISRGFPDYFARIRPDIVTIEKETAEIRGKRLNGKSFSCFGKEMSGALEENENTYEYYFRAAGKLENYVKEIDRHIPVINECYKENRFWKCLTISSFIIGISGIALAIYFGIK